MATERRWSKFWWQDWQRDPALRMCSPAARGVWMDMLCIMADAAPCGHLLVAGRQPTNRQLASIFGVPEREAAALIGELEAAGVFSREDDGAIFNRRMVRDADLSEKGREWSQRRWGADRDGAEEPRRDAKANPKRFPNGTRNPNPNAPPNGVPNTLYSEAEAEAEADSELRSDAAKVPQSPEATLFDNPPGESPRQTLWRIGPNMISNLTGFPLAKAKGFMGKMLKDAGDDCGKVVACLRKAEAMKPVDPVAWLAKAVVYQAPDKPNLSDPHNYDWKPPSGTL